MTAPAKVVNRRFYSYDVDIGRPSKWGNPFLIDVDGTRAEVIAMYRRWILSQPALLAALPELRGKRLGCWCKPEACHGDVLIELLAELDQRNAKAKPEIKPLHNAAEG